MPALELRGNVIREEALRAHLQAFSVRFRNYEYVTNRINVFETNVTKKTPFERRNRRLVLEK